MKEGILYIVSTPIGNLEDITFRAINTLKNVDLIATEDTRHSSIIFKKYEIFTKRISYYEEIEEKRSTELLHKLLKGEKIALISDAGTPGINDPGFRIIRKAIDNNIKVVPIPGPSSLLSALVGSGLATDRFVFEGFLPRKKGRKTRLQELANEPRTIIFFESPYRVVKTLKQLLENWGDRKCVAARELTKLFEEYKRGKISEVINYFSEKKPKGEFVILIEGNKNKTKQNNLIEFK